MYKQVPACYAIILQKPPADAKDAQAKASCAAFTDTDDGAVRRLYGHRRRRPAPPVRTQTMAPCAARPDVPRRGGIDKGGSGIWNTWINVLLPA